MTNSSQMPPIQRARLPSDDSLTASNEDSKNEEGSRHLEVRIYDEQSKKLLTPFHNVPANSTIGDLKQLFQSTYQHFVADRQRYRTRNKHLKLTDDTLLADLASTSSSSVVEVYFKDLGPQISWRGVFITEYFGPLIIYFTIYVLPTSLLYNELPRRSFARSQVVSPSSIKLILLTMWSIHYIKRLIESIYVHRFSHPTMPLSNLFKNCAYYWGFACWIAYLLNHPLYTPPSSKAQLVIGILLFVIGEYGNGQCHLLLRDLRRRPTDEHSVNSLEMEQTERSSTIRRIPFPNSNPMTSLFGFVSCANYTYEVLSWIGFSISSQCLAVIIFTLVGLGQMSIWAKAKHKRYGQEFPKYPKARRAIIPFIY